MEIKELWEYKIFRIGIIIHLFYFVFSIILTLFFFRHLSDFEAYYAAADVFLHNIHSLYTIDNIIPFRYFPITAIFFIPFYIMGFDLGFLFFNFTNLILNILICLIIYKIILLINREDYEKEEKNIISFLCIFLMGLSNLYNYILGQTTLYVSFLILLSLFLFLKYEKNIWNLLASFILGLSIMIKPNALLVIPFLLLIKFDLEGRNLQFNFIKSLIRLFGVITPALFNCILFFLYPDLWQGFMEINLTRNNPIIYSFSFSISRLIINFCIFYNIPINQFFILIGVLIIIGVLGFIIFLIRRIEENSIIYGYIFGILIMLLTYFDSWDHHLLNLTPLLIIAIFNFPHHQKNKIIIKYGIIFFSFFSLVFTGIWRLIYPIFPYNFETTVSLILVFYAISKYCLIKQKNNTEV